VFRETEHSSPQETHRQSLLGVIIALKVQVCDLEEAQKTFVAQGSDTLYAEGWWPGELS
jgi:hypothetical protein